MEEKTTNKMPYTSVSDEEALRRLNIIKAEHENRTWAIRNQYKRFHDSLVPGETFKAKLANKFFDYVGYSTTSTRTTRRATFTITKKWPFVLECFVYDGAHKLTCYINIKDLWTRGEETILLPSRWEDIC